MEYKELLALPCGKLEYKLVPDPTVAYTAFIHTTKKGTETLCVDIYKCSDNERWNRGNRRKLPYKLAERHFITQHGECGGTRYSAETDTFIRGTFKIGRGNSGSWDYDSLTNALIRGHYSKELENADEVINIFVRKHICKKPERQGLSWVVDHREKYTEKKAEAAKQRRIARTNEQMSAISAELPAEVMDWAKSLHISAWMYDYKPGKIQTGICSACGKKSKLEGVKHDTMGTCPKCGAAVIYLTVKTDIEYYHRYAKEIYCRYIEKLPDGRYCTRFFRCSKSIGFKKNKPTERFEFWEFRRVMWNAKEYPLKTYEIYREYYKDPCYWRPVYERWKRSQYNGPIFPGNIIEITKALNFRGTANMDLRELCSHSECTERKIFTAASRHPVIENMAKQGLYEIADYYIYCQDSLKPVDSGNVGKVLGISKDAIAVFAGLNITHYQLSLWKEISGKDNELEDFVRLYRMLSSAAGELEKISTIMKKFKLGLKRVVNFLSKNKSRNGKVTEHTLSLWRDYLDMATQLGMDPLHNKDVIFPKGLKKEHDRCSAVVEVKKNAALDAAYKERVNLLDKLCYDNGTFLIRPLRCCEEFINESNQLDHCVKTYFKSCATGYTNIYAVRRVSAPDEPYFTVNIDNSGKLIQNRGIHNCPPPADVRSFVSQWLKLVVEKRIKAIMLDPVKAKEDKALEVGA